MAAPYHHTPCVGILPHHKSSALLKVEPAVVVSPPCIFQTTDAIPHVSRHLGNITIPHGGSFPRRDSTCGGMVAPINLTSKKNRPRRTVFSTHLHTKSCQYYLIYGAFTHVNAFPAPWYCATEAVKRKRSGSVGGGHNRVRGHCPTYFSSSVPHYMCAFAERSFCFHSHHHLSLPPPTLL